MKKGLRNLGIAVGGLVLLGVGCGAGMRARFGGGVPYTDLNTTPVVDAAELEVVVTSDEPIGNIAVSNDGRIFYTIHPESRPAGNKLVEWVDGKPVAYPSQVAQAELETPLGLVVDRQDRLWVIDPGQYGLGNPRLIAFDLQTGDEVHDYRFGKDLAPAASFLQDLQITGDGSFVFIADVSFFRGSPGVVVYDVANEKAWRVLDRHPSVMPQKWEVNTPVKKMEFLGGLMGWLVGIDGIAIDRADEFVYYGAMTHDTLYRVPVAVLTDPQADVAASVEDLGPKPLNDGMSTDNEGNVYITDVEHSSVMRWRPDGTLETMIQSDRIRWADALSFGPDGWLYIADSSIPDQVLQSKSHMQAQSPYYIFRFQPGVDGVPGQ